MTYYEVVVQITTETENAKGDTKVKRHKETYLVDAMSVTEAEARVVQKFEHFSQEFQVIQVKQSLIVEVIESDSNESPVVQEKTNQKAEEELEQNEEV